MTPTIDRSDEDELLAAELAFCLLDPAERVLAKARLTADAGFADAYRRWQDRAAAMALGTDEAPRPSLWREIAAQLPAASPAPRPAPIERPAPNAATRWWQAATACATAAAIVLGVVAAERPATPAAIAAPARAPLVAVLSGAEKRAVVTVTYDRANGRLTLVPLRLDVTGHAAELWVIPTGGKPHSLGVVAPGAPSWTVAPAAAAGLLRATATLAISVEPAGGSPTGQPTGPVILTGTTVET